MNRNVDIDTDAFEHVSIPVARVVERINPQAYAEFLLRQAIADAIKAIGKDRTDQIIREEAA